MTFQLGRLELLKSNECVELVIAIGHPKTKAFITHGGTNGIYEAIYHGIPMIGIPLFADQPDNMVHMEVKGAAVVLNFNQMKTQDLVDALNNVTQNKT